MPGAGELRDRVQLLQRGLDAQQDRLGAWTEEGTRWAKVAPLRGGEGVVAGRLAGKMSRLVTVRADSLTRGVTTDWRIRIGAVLFEVKDAAVTADRAFVDLLCEKAAGRG
jgi:head-tail adaptor